MNTSITKEQFLTFRAAYKQLARDKKVTGSDIILYNMVRGFHTKRGFSTITNPVKLANGSDPHLGFHQCAYILRYQMSYNKMRPLFLEALDPLVTEPFLDTLAADSKTEAP
jgi:hypothetical protein